MHTQSKTRRNTSMVKGDGMGIQRSMWPQWPGHSFIVLWHTTHRLLTVDRAPPSPSR